MENLRHKILFNWTFFFKLWNRIIESFMRHSIISFYHDNMYFSSSKPPTNMSTFGVVQDYTFAKFKFALFSALLNQHKPTSSFAKKGSRIKMKKSMYVYVYLCDYVKLRLSIENMFYKSSNSALSCFVCVWGGYFFWEHPQVCIKMLM